MEVNKLKEDCQKEIKRYRKELDTILDNLESNILTELDKWKQDRHCHVDQNVSTIDAALNVLRVDSKRLEDAKRDGRNEAMFVADTQVSKSIHGYARKLAELEKDIEKPNLAFKRNELLADLVAGVNSLGSLLSQRISDNQDNKLPGKPYSTSSTKMLKDRNIKSRKEVNVRTYEDNKDPWISGCTVMPNGHVVLCDQSNKQIKLLDDSWTITGRLELPDPWDVSVIDSNNIIVSSTNKKQLQKIQVFPKMKAGSTIQLDRKCWGVAVSGQEIYTTCHDSSGQGEVKVLDMQGNFKRRLLVYPPRGTYLFIIDITVSASGEKIFVADGANCTVTCLTPSGTVIYTYIADNMSWPRGLICDSGDNVLVCARDSHNVHTISPDGNKYQTLLTSQDGLCFPTFIAYKESEDTLIVGCLGSNELLLLFKLA